jgi:DNA invertase Pin-like site-specific DNA recombinase
VIALALSHVDLDEPREPSSAFFQEEIAMTASSNFAAQYVRMSTDKQDLSPSVQKEAIAAYAAARGMEIVASYEDEGRSGIHLKNRPALLRLLHDVTEPKRFSTVLVYDVSRWGRFQDTDAAAYHEYHCRLHGAEVVYVAEMFGAEVNPITAMLKSMKRAMAAEYSRDLANKSRAGQHQAISRGYQIGPLPPLGYRRCSVSADGHRRVVLDNGQRKAAATDRVEWVAACQEEVQLVKRICDLYARTRLSFTDISRLGRVEGWRDHQGRLLGSRAIATLVRNEALIGNFVWGRKRHAKSIVNCEPSRHDHCIPRLIDDDTWTQMHRRSMLEISRKQTDQEIVANLRRALKRSPLLTTRDLRAQGLPNKVTLRTRLGAWNECLKQAGQDPTQLHKALFERARQRRENAREFGLAIAQKLREGGHLVTFDGRLNVINFPNLRVRLRLLWPTFGEVGQAWRIRVERISREVDVDLLVRMEDRFRPKDFFVVPPTDVVVRFPQWLTQQIPAELNRFWCRSPQQLLDRIRTINERS